MKKKLFLLSVVLLILFISQPASAGNATFTDVPKSHWAFEQIKPNPQQPNQPNRPQQPPNHQPPNQPQQPPNPKPPNQPQQPPNQPEHQVDEFFGVVMGRGINTECLEYITIAYNGSIVQIIGSIEGATRNNVVKFTLTPDGRIDTGTVLTCQQVCPGYNTYQVDSVTTAYIKLRAVNDSYEVITDVPSEYILFDASTEIWDTDNIIPISISDITFTIGKCVQVYDVRKENGTAGTDGVFDYIMIVKK